MNIGGEGVVRSLASLFPANWIYILKGGTPGMIYIDKGSAGR